LASSQSRHAAASATSSSGGSVAKGSTHSGRWLTYLEAIAVRVRDDRPPYAVADGLDRTRADAVVSEAGQERVEVVDK
jgi:hypothetical protein